MSPQAKLTRIDEYGYNLDGSRQTITIDRATGLGRTDKRFNYDDGRKIPDVFSRDVGLLLRITESGEKKYISRNHAAILPPNIEKGPFRIIDLASTNGTYINAEQIPRNTEVPLNNGDEIGLSGNDKAARFIFSIQNAIRQGVVQSGENHALMFGHSGGNLRAAPKDIQELTGLLEKRGFGNHITLIEQQATKKRIAESIEIIKRNVTTESLFVLYFSGHGSYPDGDLNVGYSSIAAAELFEWLEEFRGKILLILDGCHTAAFGEHPNFPKNAALLGHTGQGFQGRVHSVVDDNGDPEIRGFTTRAICEVLKESPHRIDVNILVDAVQRKVHQRMHDPRRSPQFFARKIQVTLHEARDVSRIVIPSHVDPIRKNK